MRRLGSTVFMVLSVLCPGSVYSQSGSPAGAVPSDLLAARRQKLLNVLEGAPAILTSAGPRGEYAQDSDYREDNGFFYLTGLEAPGAWLVFNGGGEEGAVLYLPPRSPAQERWTGAQLGPDDKAKALTGLTQVRSTDELETDLLGWLTGSGAMGEGPGNSLFVSFGHPRFEAVLKNLLPPGAVEPKGLSPILASLRLEKDADELRRLRKAVEITSEAHRELWRVASPGITEYQLEGALEYVFTIHGAERVGFPSIVGSGPNSVILHYDKNRRELEDGDLIVVDIGAEFGYYTADLTRTLPANGSFSERQKALYDLVLGAHGAGLEVIHPGATMREVNQAVRGFLETHSGNLCGEPSCAPFLIHGSSPLNQDCIFRRRPWGFGSRMIFSSRRLDTRCYRKRSPGPRRRSKPL